MKTQELKKNNNNNLEANFKGSFRFLSVQNQLLIMNTRELKTKQNKTKQKQI